MKHKWFYGWACFAAMLMLFAVPAAAAETLPADGAAAAVQEEAALPQPTEPAAEAPADDSAEIREEAADVTNCLYQFGSVSTDRPTPLALTAEAYTMPGTGSPEWQTIRNGLENWQEVIDLSAYNIPTTEIETLYFTFLNANPQLFYVDGYFRYSYRGDAVVAIKPRYDLTYTQEDINIYEAAIKKVLSSLPQGLDSCQKALVLHDYLAQHCTYDTEHHNYNAYNALVDQRAVCQGYMLAYTDLLQRSGVPVVNVDSDEMDHTWNAVQLDGQWYHVDVTWDDPTADKPGRALHVFFLLSDDAMKTAGWSEEKHHDWKAAVTCGDTKYDSGQLWSNVTSSLVFNNGSVYYISAGSVVRQAADGTVTKVAETNISNESAMLSAERDRLYYNDNRNVYQITLPEETIRTVYTCDAPNKYIYGCMQSGGILYLSVGNTSRDCTLITCPLPQEGEPEPELPDQFEIEEDSNRLLGVTKETSPEELRSQLQQAGEVVITDKNNVPLTDGQNVGTGCKVTLPGREQALTVVVPCDVDGDGQVGLTDVVQTRKAMVKILKLEEEYLEAAQPTGTEDTRPGLSDIIYIRKVFSKIL